MQMEQDELFFERSVGPECEVDEDPAYEDAHAARKEIEATEFQEHMQRVLQLKRLRSTVKPSSFFAVQDIDEDSVVAADEEYQEELRVEEESEWQLQQE